MIKTITSAQNPLIQRAIKLHTSKYRASFQEFIAEGGRTIHTLIESNLALRTLFATEENITLAEKLTSSKNIILVPKALMNKMSTAGTPSGLLALFSIPAKKDITMLSGGIVLAQIQDPGNAGTLIRTAAAMNKKTVVFVESVDPWSPKVVQASAGTIGFVSIFSLSWNELINNKKHLKLYGLVVSEGSNPDTISTNNALLVIGNEANGIPQEWINQCDATINLPMPGQCESLNAAVAGSIALYITTIKTNK